MDEHAWHRFLQQVVLAREYQLPFELAQHVRRSEDAVAGPKNPVLEELLPSLLFVRLASVLDEYLEDYIQMNDIRVSDKRSLYDRIEALRHPLTEAERLQGIRKRRRPLAHEAAARCTWDDLEEAVAVVHQALRELGYVVQRPVYVIASHWHLDQLDPPRVERSGLGVIEWRAIRTYTVGVKEEDGEWVDTYAWSVGDTVVRAPRENE